MSRKISTVPEKIDISCPRGYTVTMLRLKRQKKKK